MKQTDSAKVVGFKNRSSDEGEELQQLEIPKQVSWKDKEEVKLRHSKYCHAGLRQRRGWLTWSGDNGGLGTKNLGCQVPHLYGHLSHCEHPQELEQSAVTEHCGPEYALSLKLGTLLGSQVSQRKQREKDISRSRMSEESKVLCKMKMKMA